MKKPSEFDYFRNNKPEKNTTGYKKRSRLDRMRRP